MSRRMFNTAVLKDTWEAGKAAAEGDQEDDQLPDRTRNEDVIGEYVYEKLKEGALSFRLVKLLPGTRQDDIACRMYETRLDECAGSYEALSYVWGDTSEKTPIQVNGLALQVGTNLRLALLNLRTDKSRTLWIDAICINQGSGDERNQQVAIMGEIYRRANRTVVWLRDDVEGETDTAISMLKTLAEEVRSSSANGDGEGENIVHLNNMPKSMIERADVADPMFDRYRNDASALHILKSAWWYRAWTLQEILLASSATIMVGRYSIDWDDLRIGANHGLNLGIWQPITMGVLHDPNIKPFLSLQMLKLKQQAQDPEQSPGQALLELLFECRFREATDSRDKIYSLLGLVACSNTPSTQALPPLGIKPDYSSPVDTIYTNVARQMILESNTLDVLGGCGASLPLRNTVPVPDFPSWVPDWNTAQAARPLLQNALRQQRATHATAHSKAWPQFADTGRTTLVLYAHEVSTVVALAPPLREPEFKLGVNIEEEFEKVFATVDENALSLRYLWDLLGTAWNALAHAYEGLTSVVPFLATFAEWEAFATAVPSTNPGPGTLPSKIIDAPVHNSRELDASETPDEEPEDRLAVYWQTLCTGTYDDTPTDSPERGRKIETQKLFYGWRASLKPIYHLHRWRADRMLRPLALMGYAVKTSSEFGQFADLLKCSYGRRLGRAANGYLCLLPVTAEVGDKVVLARGGRVPLLMREDKRTGYWQLGGEAYVQGIMDGESWEEGKCKEIKVR